VDYTYLVASLPYLEFAGAPPMSPAAFLEYCEGLMAPADHDALRRVVAGDLGTVAHPAVRHYAACETQLRNAVARARAARTGADAERVLREHPGWEAGVEERAVQAMAMPDPLEREKALDRVRWQLLEELAVMPAFGVQAVYAYALKLCLLEKWQSLSDERGAQTVAQIIEENVVGISL
jgi:hypothetical protein